MKGMIDCDLHLLTILALVATFHNHPGVIRDIVRDLEPRVSKRRRAMLIAIRKNKDPRGRILLGLEVYETPPEDLPKVEPEPAPPAGPTRDPKTGRWMKRQ